MKKNYKSLLSIALVLLLVAITSLTFAYWDQLTDTKDGGIDIGQGKSITIISETVPTTKKLIPSGALKASDETYLIEVTYEVSIPEFNSNFEFQVEANTNETLLVVDVEFVQFSETVKTQTVTLKFTLTEPTDQAAYDALQTKALAGLTYDVTFTYVNTTPEA